jgi:hypothetical protein
VKKALLCVVLPVLLMIGVIVTYYMVQCPKKSFDDLLGTDEANITKVVMGYGPLPQEKRETLNKDKIKELTGLLNKRSYARQVIQEMWVGSPPSLDFYLGSKSTFRMSFYGNDIEINDTYYSVSKDIDSASLIRWFKSLPVKDKQR